MRIINNLSSDAFDKVSNRRLSGFDVAMTAISVVAAFVVNAGSAQAAPATTDEPAPEQAQVHHDHDRATGEQGPAHHEHDAVSHDHGQGHHELDESHHHTFGGNAHWYGKELHGHPTASGELFDKEKLTAAHPSIPLGTHVRVKSLLTGKEVIIKVNDRCPVTSKRVIDLSEAAAKTIGIWPGKRSNVHCTVLGKHVPAHVLAAYGHHPVTHRPIGVGETVLAVEAHNSQKHSAVDPADAFVAQSPPRHSAIGPLLSARRELAIADSRSIIGMKLPMEGLVRLAAIPAVTTSQTLTSAPAPMVRKTTSLVAKLTAPATLTSVAQPVSTATLTPESKSKDTSALAAKGTPVATSALPAKLTPVSTPKVAAKLTPAATSTVAAKPTPAAKSAFAAKPTVPANSIAQCTDVNAKREVSMRMNAKPQAAAAPTPTEECEWKEAAAAEPDDLEM